MEKRRKVILVDGMQGDQAMPALEETEELSKIGADLVVLGCRSEDDIIAQAQDADAILTVGAPMTRRVLEKLQRLQKEGPAVTPPSESD